MSTSSSLLQRATARLSRSRPWALPPPKLAVASSLPTPKIAVASSLPFSATVSFGTTPMVTRSRQVKPTRTNIPPPFPDTILASARALARENRSRPWRPSHPTTSAAPVKPSAVPLRTPSGPFRTPAAAKFGLQSFSQWVLTQPLYNVNPRPLSRPSSHFGDETLELIKNVLVFDKPSAPTSSPPAAPKRRVRFLSSSFAPPRVLRSILKKPGSDNHQAKRVTFAKRAKRIRVLRWIGVLDVSKFLVQFQCLQC